MADNKLLKRIANTFDVRLLPLDCGKLLCAPALLYYRIKAYDTDGNRTHKAVRGGAIVAMNHTGFEDPVISGTVFWYRRNFFLAAEAVMQGRIRSFLLRSAGCIKIDRNISDIDAMRKAIKRLKQMHLLTVFPQGRIMEGDEVSSVKAGIILLSLQSGAPIIPVYHAKRSNRIKRQIVVMGKPIDCAKEVGNKMPSMQDIQRLSDELAARMDECRQAYIRITEQKEIQNEQNR